MKFTIFGIPYYFKAGDLYHYFKNQGIDAFDIEIAEDEGRPRGFAYFQLDLTPLEAISFLNKEFSCQGKRVRIECVEGFTVAASMAPILLNEETSFIAPVKICQYCPGTDFLKIEVNKAYRRGGSVYYRGIDGEHWLRDEFNFETPLKGLVSAGDIALTICLDCFRLQSFKLTAEQKQSLIKEHVDLGYNPCEIERQKQARQEANRKEREAKQALYDNWRPNYYLYVFYDKDQDSRIFHQLEQSIAQASKQLSLVKLEWNSNAAYKPKIRYNIHTRTQCCLTDSRGGDIVRLSTIPKDIFELASMLDGLGYRQEAKTILGAFYE